ncbi:hypothetical protein JCM5350_003554 [Sporobolomyces pararoseus]
MCLGKCSEGEQCRFNHQLPHCATCQRYFLSTFVLGQHLGGKPHRKRARALGQEDEEAIKLENGLFQCRTCLCTMHSNLWYQHVNSRKHKYKVVSRVVREANRQADVRIVPDGEIDFGLIEFDKVTHQTKGYTATKQIKIEVDGLEVTLDSITLVQNGQTAKAHRHFSVQTFANPISLPPNHYLDVSLHFFPRNDIGSYRDELVFNFSTPGGGSVLAIRKTVRGSVGVKNDINQFSAKVPFVKPATKNRPRAQPKDTVVAPPDEYHQRIPYTLKLPHFPIPEWLRQLLESSTIAGSIKSLRGTIGSLSYGNYGKFWSILLHAELYQQELDVHRYDIDDTSLQATPNGRYLCARSPELLVANHPHPDNHFFLLCSLTVEGLAEKRPSVLQGDKIKVQIRNSSDKRWFEGVVTSVELSRVLLKFAKSFKPQGNARFDVQFTVSRIPLRRQLQALGSPLPRQEILFPSGSLPSNAATGQHKALAFFSKAIGTNHSQKQAVESIVNNTSGVSPYVVFGPPGTGKTVTIIEACQQLMKDSDTKILLTAPSNAAADLLCTRLNFSKEILFRLNAPSRLLKNVPSNVRDVSCIRDDAFSCPDLEDLSQYRIIVSTCSSASILRGVGVEAGHFSHIFIDEAGQSTEPEAFLSLSLASEETSVILAGDPKQLGPIVRSPVSSALGLSTSFLETIMKTPLYDQNNHDYRGITYTKLVRNYRNHEAILSTSNEEFYNNELVPCAPPSITGSLKEWDGWPKKDFPIIFHAVKGRDEREGRSPSFFNVAEISIVRQYFESLKNSRRVKVLDSDVGIISPYSAQCSKLRTALNQKEHPELTIGSVEQFQGSERSIILMSTVRSNEDFLEHDKRFALGFLGNEKRFNVAVTRPQAGLIIVGDPDILALDPLWCRFLVFVRKNGGWCGQEWNSSAFENEEA